MSLRGLPEYDIDKDGNPFEWILATCNAARSNIKTEPVKTVRPRKPATIDSGVSRSIKFKK